MASVSMTVKVKGVESFKEVMTKLGDILEKYNINEKDTLDIGNKLASYFLDIK